MNKFLNVDKTKLVFMGCLAGTKAAGPIALRENAVLFSTGLLDDEVYGLGYPVVNLATQLSAESRFLAAHIAASGVKKVALLRWPDAFGEEFARSLKAELEARQLQVPMDESSSTMGNDYRSLLIRVRQSGADAIATNLGDAQIRTLMQQIRESRLALRVFSNYVVETNTAPTAVLNGVEYTYPVNDADGSPARKDFDARFSRRFGGAPSANTYFAYDGLLALDRALERCATEDSICIRSFILKNLTSGLSGAVNFKPDGSNLRPYGAKRVENAQYVWLKRDLQ